MKTAPSFRRVVMGAALAASLFLLWQSTQSLGRFPSISSDEIDNAHMALNLGRTGRIYSTLMDELIDPKFRDLNSVNPTDGLRGVYLGILALMEKAIGTDAIRLRAGSLVVGVATAVVLFAVGTIGSGPLTGVLAAFFWTAAPDAVTAAHLIRPDILLALFLSLVVLLLLPKKDRWSNWRYFGAGLLAALSVGLHPHGLLLLAVVFLIAVTDLFVKEATLEQIAFLGGGLLAGALLFALTADWPSFALGQFTYIHQLFKTHEWDWLARMQPVRLVKSFFQLLLHPGSYYVDVGSLQKNYSEKLGLGPAVLIMVALFWPVRNESIRRPARLLRIGLVIVTLGIGIARVRDEFLYLVVVTVFSAPLSALVCVDAWEFFLREGGIKSMHTRSLLPFLVGGILVPVFWGMAARSSGALQQAGFLFEYRWARVRELTGPEPGKVAGPSEYWFVYGDSFRSIDAFLLNRYYSGRPETRESFSRFKPNHLIVDEPFIRRVLVERRENGRMRIKSVAETLGVPAELLGTIPAQGRSSPLALYRLDWPAGKSTSAR